MLRRYVYKQADFEKLVNAPWILRDKLILRLLFVTGMRSGELIKLKTSDADLENKTIRIFDSKKYCYFTVPIDSKTCNMLTEYMKDKHSWLFPSRSKNGSHLCTDSINKCIIRFYAEKIGLNPSKFNARTFRRRFARNWVLKGGNLLTLQEILRHEYFATTAHYVDSIRFECELESVHLEYEAIMEATS